MKFAPHKFLIILVALILSNSLFAAPNPPEPIPPVPPGAPIDSGIIFCVLLSIVYSFYKLYVNKKASI